MFYLSEGLHCVFSDRVEASAISGTGLRDSDFCLVAWKDVTLMDSL